MGGPNRDRATQRLATNRSIGEFRGALGEFDPQLESISGMLIERGLGTATDPLIEAQRNRTLERTRGLLSRRGVLDSTAGIDTLADVSGQFDEAALARRDQALQAGLGLGQTRLQNRLAEPAIRTAQLAAMNAGRSGGGGKGKGGK